MPSSSTKVVTPVVRSRPAGRAGPGPPAPAREQREVQVHEPRPAHGEHVGGQQRPVGHDRAGVGGELTQVVEHLARPGGLPHRHARGLGRDLDRRGLGGLRATLRPIRVGDHGRHFDVVGVEQGLQRRDRHVGRPEEDDAHLLSPPGGGRGRRAAVRRAGRGDPRSPVPPDPSHLLERGPAVVAGEVVDEQDPVQVVHLVQPDAGQQPLQLDRALLTVRGPGPAHRDAQGAIERVEQAGEGQATLVALLQPPRTRRAGPG